MSWLADAYPWIKSAHIVSVVAWLAGLLYLPRLFVYHAEAAPGSDQSETFKLMERRLLRGIMNPAMIATLIFGALLAATPGLVDWSMGWIWVKLTGVAGLSLLHHLYARWRKDFAADKNTRPAKFYRLANEIPMVILIVIVVMVVAKPF
ncbi:MAG TPA: protoporphyrinogen oxidase HemJ [Stellaceae bacterium]|jgi:putative membrane protein|nr:protoporphyrinogen oxidase HemJ [Stellaceae bacterium]